MSSFRQVVNASSQAVHLRVLVADGFHFDYYDICVHYLAVYNLLDSHTVEGEHSILDTFLQEHFLFIGEA